jgi:hypothetical protein
MLLLLSAAERLSGRFARVHLLALLQKDAYIARAEKAGPKLLTGTSN